MLAGRLSTTPYACAELKLIYLLNADQHEHIYGMGKAWCSLPSITLHTAFADHVCFLFN
jgi:hypothetical protein